MILLRLRLNFTGGTDIIALNVVLVETVAAAPFGGSFFGLLSHISGFAWIILLLLLLFSLLSWSIIFRKWLTFKQIGHKKPGVRGHVPKERSPERSRLGLCSIPWHSLIGHIYRRVPGTQYDDSVAESQKSRPSRIDRSAAYRDTARAPESVHRRAFLIERSMSWLATTGAVTPFIGLLGTVVGIINAFTSLGFEKTASIQAVAPGIAEALFTTAAGLFAAIPAVIAYNHFIARMKNIAAEMDDFSAEFLNLVERSFS